MSEIGLCIPSLPKSVPNSESQVASASSAAINAVAAWPATPESYQTLTSCRSTDLQGESPGFTQRG